MKSKKFLSLALSLVMALSLAVPAMAQEAPTTETTAKDIVILHTNDVHGNYDKYTNLAAYKTEMEKDNYVTLVDAGDFSQGAAIAILSKGEHLINIMNAVGYDIVVPGNHEFDYGMEQALKNLDTIDATVVSCNFVSLATNKPVYEGYVLKQYGDVTVAFVGVSTPETYTKSTPAYFQNEKGEYIYSFCETNFYPTVQAAVDEAKAAGADYIIGIGHLGIDESSSPYTSKEVIANTNGIDAFIDGHSHSRIEDTVVANKDGKEIPLAQTGEKLGTIGKVTIKADGTITAELVKDYDQTSAEVDEAVAGIEASFKEYTAQVVATSEVDLQMTDANGTRLVRNNETNLGDMIADAYRVVMGADIGIMNGGGIRANVAAGDVKIDDILAVMTFGNMATVVEVTGQQIIDCLEMGSFAYPGETGGFTHVSGLTYTIDATVESTIVKDEKGNFESVAGARRVKDVMVGDEPIDLEKIYSVACHSYWLTNYGDGMVMFQGGKVVDEKHELYVDNVMLVKYIQENLDGKITAEQYGQSAGRITIHYPMGKFTDIKADAWYVAPITEVVNAEILVGTSETTFSPEATLTVAEIYQTLYNIAGTPADTETEGEWWTDAMNWAAETGIYGLEVENFTNHDAPRSEVNAIMNQYLETIGAPATELFQGNQDGEMMWEKTITRAEWAQVLVRVAATPMPIAE